jgi:hypothetical protein
MLGKGVRSGARHATRGYQAVRTSSEAARLEAARTASAPELPPESDPGSAAPDVVPAAPAAVPARPRPGAARSNFLPRQPAAPAASSPGAGSGSDAQPSAAASWGQIGDALANKDEARAKKLLSSLARDSGDDGTRAKAQLGLAQLALAGGDCRRASKLALAVARTPGLDAKLVARAHDIVVRCDAP